MLRQLTRLAPVLVAMASAVAQTTWTVTQINGVQAAIQSAAPGDIILLPNTGGFPDYYPFTVDKGVTIRGNGCRIGYGLAGGPSGATYQVIVTVPAGQRAHLDGLDLTYAWIPLFQANIGLGLAVTGGSLTVQRCNIVNRINNTVSVSNASVLFQSCTIQSNGLTVGGVAIHLQASHVSVCDSIVIGSNDTYYVGPFVLSAPARAAVAIAGGTLHAERTSFTGGSYTGTPSPSPGACGIEVSGPASVWLSDSSVVAGSGTTGGNAVCNSGVTSVQLTNTTLTPGTPGGTTSTMPVNPNAPLVRLSLAPAWQRGTSSTLTCRGAPGTLFGLGIALDPAPTFHPFTVEPLWSVTNVPIVAGLLDANGLANLTVAVPLAPSLENMTVWCQAVSGPALPLHTTTLAGGLIL